MPFHILTPQLTKGAALLNQRGVRSLDELLAVCHLGLDYIARNSEAFCEAISFCTIIMPHFEDELARLIRFLEPHADAAPADPESFFGDVQGCAFALVEDIALFMREKKLRTGCALQHPTEERILAYFEGCGKWRREYGELVTDLYYSQLPLAVQHGPDISRHA